MIDIERFLGRYLSLLVRSYNPNNYVKLVEIRMREILRFLFISLLSGLGIFILAFIFSSMNYVADLPEKLDSIDKFEVTGSLESNETVLLVEDPEIVVDLHGNSSEGDVVISKHGILYPAHVLFGKTFAPWSELNDFKRQTEERDLLLRGVVIFLLPSLLFWFFIMSLAKLVLLFCVILLAGYYLPRMFKHRIAFREVFKTAILAMPSAILFGVGLNPVGRELFWWGALLTVLLYGTCIILLSERRLRTGRRRKV